MRNLYAQRTDHPSWTMSFAWNAASAGLPVCMVIILENSSGLLSNNRRVYCGPTSSCPSQGAAASSASTVLRFCGEPFHSSEDLPRESFAKMQRFLQSQA